MASLLVAHSVPSLNASREACFASPWSSKISNSLAFCSPPIKLDSRSEAAALAWKDGAPPSPSRVFRQAVSDAASLTQPSVEGSRAQEEEVLPTPIVVIDQESDPDATVVEISFGNRLGALLDTMQALTELGLNVVKSRISVEGPITRKRFSITRVDTGRKIADPEMLEAIRLTIISNMLQYHPESSTLLAMGQAFGIKPPDQLDIDIATHIHISDDGPQRSLLYIETADRPGLLREIVKVLADVNVVFESGEFDTEGLLAKAKFHVNYRGAALIKPMQQVLINCFHYFLRRPETNEDSY